MSSTTTAPQQTATQTASSGAFGSFPIANQTYPEEGSRVISLQYNWTSVTGYSDDLSQLVALGVETTIQTAYIDNSSNAQSVTITIPATGQVLTCPALSQGFFPLMFTGTPQFQVTVAATAANAVTRIALLNVPISQGPWAASVVVPSGTPVPPVAPGTAPAGVSGGLSMAVASTAAPAYADTTVEPLSMFDTGGLRVTLVNSSGGAAFPAQPVPPVGQGGTTAGQTGALVLGAVTTAAPAYTTGQVNDLSLDTSGQLRVALAPGSNGGPVFPTPTNGNNVSALAIAGMYLSAPVELTGGNPAVLQMDAWNSVLVNSEGVAPAYSAGAVFTSAATPTDCFTIYGSNTKTIRVHEITINGTDTSGGGIFLCEIIKRGSAPTGGTSSAVTVVPHDSSNPAATATVQSFTVNPTSVGALVGLVEATAVGITPNSSSPNFPFKYGPGAGDQSIVLRGTAQGLAVNFLGASIGTGTQLAIRVKWSEV